LATFGLILAKLRRVFKGSGPFLFSMTNCLVTGANGFVGRALVERLREMGRFSISVVVRKDGWVFPPGVAVYSGFDLAAVTDWIPVLSGIECVVHLAARVHVIHDNATDTLEMFRKINVEGTLAVARQSAAAGVRRFVFISSIKVNGEGTACGHPYTPDDAPAPTDPYGISKCEAEFAVRQLAATTGMEVVIIRPTLVYGTGVKANFLSMMRWLNAGIPLPFGATKNKRSLVALGNLADLIVTCIDHPAAANQTFLVSDGEDLSTTQLLRGMGRALGKPARLLPVPVWMLQIGAALLGRRDLSQRLLGNLQVDISKTKNLLGWSPPLSLDEGLCLAAEGFLENWRKVPLEEPYLHER
jgi:nucleoside-diphosphate-sugar epimerase